MGVGESEKPSKCREFSPEAFEFSHQGGECDQTKRIRKEGWTPGCASDFAILGQTTNSN